MRRLCLAAVFLGLCVRTGAFDATINPLAIQEAVALGQSRLGRDRERFHRGYRVMIAKAPVDAVEIVTPFRRIVLEAEARAASGDRRFGQRQALELLANSRDRIDVYVELSFHPLNTFVGVPVYEVTLHRAADPMPREPLSIERIPRFGPRVNGTPLPVPTGPAVPGGSQPMLGGTIIARFDASALEATAAYDVVIRDSSEKQTRPASELARARVDFATMR